MAKGSGTLGAIELRPPEDLDTGAKRLDVYQDALAQVQSRGIMAPSLPNSGYRGEMPQDLTGLGDDDLGDLLNNLSQYTGYVESELAKAQALVDSAKGQFEFIYARVRIGIKSLSEGRLTDRDKTDLVITDSRVVDAQAKVIYSESVYRLTRTIREQAQRNWETVSRRITQRGQEIERMKRDHNVAGIQGPPQGARHFNRPQR
jgi:hypothetical protein